MNLNEIDNIVRWHVIEWHASRRESGVRQIPMSHPLFPAHEQRCAGDGEVVRNWQKGHALGNANAPLCIGSRDDPTTDYFVRFCQETERPLNFLDVHAADHSSAELLHIIEHSSGVYLRITEVPEAAGLSALLTYFTRKHPNAIYHGERTTNWCKPLHAASLRRAGGNGILVPNGHLVSSALAGPWVTKAMSSMRTYVLQLPEGSYADPHCMLYQQRIAEGNEVRVHILDGTEFACEVLSSSLDYRQDNALNCRRFNLDPAIASVLRDLTISEGLRFSGIDAKIGREGSFEILEVNPMPGYHSYEAVLESHEISSALYMSLCNH